MKIAYLILAHKDPQQIIDLICHLSTAGTTFVVHIDGRAPGEVFQTVRRFAEGRSDVLLAKREKCYWGRYGIVRATLNCIEAALRLDFDYAILISGQDFPIRSNRDISAFLEQNAGSEFIESFPLAKPNRWTPMTGAFNALNRIQFMTLFFRSRRLHLKLKRRMPLGLEPHGGSQWWTLTKPALRWIHAYVEANPAIQRYFRFVFIPDELFFQTVLSSSPFQDKIAPDLHFIDWQNPNPACPRTFVLEDFERLIQSRKLFARKIDRNRSSALIEALQRSQ